MAAPTSYTELQTEIALWLVRDDLETIIPNFIAMGERRINRVLRVPEMENTVNLTVTDGVADLPSDFLQARAVYSGGLVLEVMGLAQFKRTYPDQQGGPARHFTIAGNEIQFGPGGTFVATMDYYANIEPLSAINPTNWLLETDYDVYLAAALVEGFTYLRDPEGMSIWSSRLSSALADVMSRARKKTFGSGPLVARVYVPGRYTGATAAPEPTPAPVFSILPSISPTSGIVGDLFTASDGTASNATSYARRWLLDGNPQGIGTTINPGEAGDLVLEVTATGPGGTTVAYSDAVEVSAPPALNGALDFTFDTQSGLLALLEDI